MAQIEVLVENGSVCAQNRISKREPLLRNLLMNTISNM